MQTNQQNPVQVSFGVIADLQYCDADPLINRYFRNAPAKLHEAIRFFNRRQLDFVVNLGDTIDHDYESFDGILPLFSSCQAPVYHVLGNHDYEVEDDKKEAVHKKLGIQKYYSFRAGGWRFIVLDGNEISTFANMEGSAKYQEAQKMLSQLEDNQKVNAMFWNGGISEVQFQWLKGILDEVKTLGEKAVIFCHYPVYPPDKHNLWNDEKILDLLKNYSNLKLWINGHNHHGNYGQFGDVHFINVKGIVDGESELAFSIFHLYEEKIIMIGYGKEISATLAIY